MQKINPAQYQPNLPMQKLILEDNPGEEAVPMDVVFVGGGPAGLAGAIELARLAKKDAEDGGGLGELEIGVLEKAERLGDHCLSGAVVNPTGYPFWTDHFVCPGQATIPVAPDEYEWEIERGPEYRRSSGRVKVKAGETAEVKVTLTPIASLRDEGWCSGDLHVHRPVSEIEQLMSAEDLDFAPVIGWWNSPAPNAVAA